MQRILVLLEGVNFGGQQYYVLNLFRELKQITNVSVHIGYLFNETEELRCDFEEEFEEVFFIPFPSRSKKELVRRPVVFFVSVFRLLKKLYRAKYSHVFTNGFYTFVLGSVLRAIWGCQSHTRLVGGDLKRNETFFFNSLLRLFPLYYYTDVVLSWPQQIDYLRSRGFKVKTLNNFNPIYAVDSNLFRPIPREWSLMTSLGIESGQSVIGWVGRIAPDLELEETIELCLFLKRNYPNFSFKLLIVGSGVGLDNLKKRLMDVHLYCDTVIVPGVSQVDLVKFYSIIDFEVLLDEDPQGGSHIREAMSCGRVVVSVDGVSGVQSMLIEDSVTGILVSPKNRIEESALRIVTTDISTRIKYGEAARNFIVSRSYLGLAMILKEEFFVDEKISK